MLSFTRNVLSAVCLGSAGAALLTSRTSAEDKEDTVPLDKVPPVVLAAARKEAPAAVWKEAVKVEEEDEVSYEISGVLGSGAGKRLITVEVGDDGEVILVAEMIDKAKVPAKVMKAFTKQFTWNKETYAFEVREEGKIANYEVLTTRSHAAGKGKKKKKAKGTDEAITVIISPDGKTVEVEGEDD
jgi:hypothetical protein